MSDHLSLFYAGVEVSIEMRDGARHLRANLHRGHGIDGARSLHHFVDISAICLDREVLRFVVALELEGGKYANGHSHDPYDHPMAF